MTKLNLGCGQNKLDGHVNVDKYDAFAPDIVWDLESFPWPFETSSASEIVMHHSLEHMGATVECFLAIMRELYRVSAPGAQIFLSVPHPRSDSFAGDPTHVRAITNGIMSLFSKRMNREWKRLGWPNTPLGTYIDVNFETTSLTYTLTPHWLNQLNSGKITRDELNFAIETYFNVVEEIKLTLQVCKP